MRIYTENEILEIIREKGKQFKTQKAYAASLEISPQYLSDILNKRRSVTPLALKMGFDKRYIKKEQPK